MAFTKYWRKKLILAKIESPYGTDTTPTAALNAMLTMNGSFKASADQLKRDYDQPYFGGKPFSLVGKKCEIEFDVELAGSGTPGTAPAYAPLLKACGLAEVLVATTSATYTPITGSFQSVVMYVWMDGTRHIVRGVRGTVALDMSIKKFGTLHFKLTGFYDDPADVALPAPVYTAFKAPLPIEMESWEVTLGGFTCDADSLTADLANVVALNESSENREVVISDRDTTGTAKIYAPTLAAFNFFTTATAESLLALSAVVGADPGNIVTLSAPGVQISLPEYAELNGNVGLNVNLSFVPSAGNDEISLAFT